MLRGKTDTVASFPLICGSIMGKKIAEGIQGLVLDIKIGNGAFIKDAKEANKLGQLLATIGCLLYTSPSPRDRQKSRMPSSA